MNRMKAWGVLVLLLVFSLAATAQTYEGRILGTVTDKSGGTVKDAKVTITNVGTGVSRNLVTNEAGDYGIPTSLPWGMSFPNGLVPTTERVHPTPIYEFLVAVAIFYYLWRQGAKSLRGPRPTGEIFASYLVLTGVARFLVEFIRINPRSVLGLTNAQVASLLSIVAGGVLLGRLRSCVSVRSGSPRG